MQPWAGLAGRSALVTGGAQGIGFAVARALGEAGCNVALLDRKPDTAQIAGKLGAALGDARQVSGHVADVRDRRALEAVRDDLAASGIRPEIIVANAGVNTRLPALEVPDDRIREILDTNLYGVFVTLQTFVPQAVAAGGGRVIVNGSVIAVHGMVRRAAYTASKAGLSGLVRSLALEWGPLGVTVNAVGPGVIRTPLTEAYMQQNPERAEAAVANTPLRRIGTPEEVADVVLFLASDAARFVTGQTIIVDGGLSAGSEWW